MNWFKGHPACNVTHDFPRGDLKSKPDCDKKKYE